MLSAPRRPGKILQSETAEAASHDAGYGMPVYDDLATVGGANQVTRQGRERAAAAHELHALLVVTAQQLLHMLKRALRQRRP